MIPIGVFVYSPVGATTPLRDEDSIWNRRKKTAKNPPLKQPAKEQQRLPSADRAQHHRFAAISLARVCRRIYSPDGRRVSLGYSPASNVNPPSSSSRPKHVPIVVPHYAPSVAPNSACYSTDSNPSKSSADASTYRSSLTRYSPSIADLPLPSRNVSANSTTAKSRHVEILIPNWAAPIQNQSALPLTSESGGTLVLSSPLASSKHATAVMARQTPNSSRTNTIDSQTAAPSPNQLVNSSQTSLNRPDGAEAGNERPPMSASIRTPGSGGASGGPSPAMLQTAGLSTPSNSTSGLSGLVCNVHRTTGREPHPLVGATTTILGDKLYVFGGRRLSRTRPQLTADLYELDLVRRHWTKLDTKGDIPPPRYFHSVCALGDTKLVCYGGMSPAAPQTAQPAPPQQGSAADAQPEVVVMSDIHIYDVPTRTWMNIATVDSPQGRYAHCATILPSSAVFASASAPMAAIQHNPPSTNPNQGSLGVQLDGNGGAEMVVVGGQDSANHYIEQISVFNLRSLKWTATNTLGRSCGAYRSVIAPLSTMEPSKIGTGPRKSGEAQAEETNSEDGTEGGSSMLIYSNYNFLDVRLELQVRLPDGTLSEKPMHGNFSPPGLRFPNGGIIDNHFVVSGTFLTSSKQEYALWALDLRSLTWSRIDAGGSIFSQGSWNRGVLWNRRNCFVILGNRKRNLVEDYNHRRINFSNICVVELEAFGLYDNPRKSAPNSAYHSISSPIPTQYLDGKAGGRQLFSAAAEMGQLALGIRELADMDFLAMGGERIPVNSHLVARRWGPYFNHLLREGSNTHENADTATLRPSNATLPSRNSSITITPSVKTSYSNATTLTNNTGTENGVPSSFDPPEPRAPLPASRPRTLYLPHTHLTIQALIHYLYTSSLPPPSSQLCSPQILCSLLQLARPYHIDGLLEAIVERLHVLLDGRNTAAIFNAAAMAAGGGSGVTFVGVTNGAGLGLDALSAASANSLSPDSAGNGVGSSSGDGASAAAARSLDAGLRALRINTDVSGNGARTQQDDEVSSASTSTSTSASEIGSASGIGSEREVWAGELSAVVGLQKRGLRGLMEGRRIREMGRGGSGGGASGSAGADAGEGRVGLGIAQS
ncbi:galactose oxidase [Mytilinidion resinicola]|uniref:Galactose oxidase n=1 Tax=Mytilinidion resinicola TaxID=574789 RepID=A0A6A6Z1K4_9PEZI|nr:galactose oxidase [Mytilinidion resinicola]KAF2815036.1 galactose oxidase [Mytilinidion resinicola]